MGGIGFQYYQAGLGVANQRACLQQSTITSRRALRILRRFSYRRAAIASISARLSATCLSETF
jgi:hypothetical protein